MGDNDNDGKVVEIGTHAYMTVDEAVEWVARNRERYSEILILGFDKHDGRMLSTSWHMTRADANYLIDVAKIHVLDPLYPGYDNG